jgi:type I restriction enzyme S subunit
LGDLEVQPESSSHLDLLDGYRRTEIGILPQEWKLVQLKDLFTIQQGKALSKKNHTGLSLKPFLRTANVLWGRVDLTTVDSMDFSDKELAKLSLMPGDLLVCEGGDIGRTAMWHGEIEECCYQNHVHRLRTPRLDVDPAFYMYWMQAALRLLGLYKGAGNRTTIPNLSKARLGSFAVPLPPLPQQKAIAHVLHTVQKAIESTEKVIETSRELKRSLMNHLFTYGPVSVDEAEQVPLKETEVSPVPEYWEVVRVGDVATVRRGASPRPKGDPRYFAGARGPVHWIKISDLRLYKREKHLESTNEYLTEEGKKKSYFVPSGTLLLTNSGTVGLPAILSIDGCIHDGYLALLDLQVDKTFLYYFLEDSKQDLEKIAPKGTQANLNTTLVKNFLIALPSRSEQLEIVKLLDSVGSKIIAEGNRKLSLKVLFQTLLHNLMTGKVRVNGLDFSAVKEMV